MERNRSRQFSLMDVITLIAAFALGLAYIRNVMPDHWALPAVGSSMRMVVEADFPSRNWIWWAAANALQRLTYLSSITCACSLAVLAARLRRGRVKRGLVREPGLVATMAVSVSLVYVVPSVSSVLWQSEGGQPNYPSLIQQTSLAVAAAWALMAIGGRWRSTGDWLDGAGIFIGLVWIVRLPLSLLYSLMSPS